MLIPGKQTIQADIEVECARLGKPPFSIQVGNFFCLVFIGRMKQIDSLSDGSFLLQFDNQHVAERCIELMHGTANTNFRPTHESFPIIDFLFREMV